MDPNWRRISTNNNKAELEKFSRRLIRAVARMLLQEKRDEEEVWEGLKKETGFDCKELWFRMRALTMKKLDRLLEVDDEVERLPKAARMSVTDWLLFDTVLVHQNVDVIGMTETSTEDKKVLGDLFDLVEKFKLEFLAGEHLAEAWSAATICYNKNNRQCTPMLLQRRWYQLKLATRARFYKFWSMYKGVIKRLCHAEPYKPTPLQTAIAKRHKPLVVSQFMTWEDLITNKLVILQEEFTAKGMQKEDAIEENVPDVICVEQNVESIDLDNESENELEYRKAPQSANSAAIKIKQEPKDDYEMDIDETVPYQSRQEKISYVAEAVMEATTLELEEIESAEHIDASITNTEAKKLSTDEEVIEVTSKETENTTTLITEENIASGCQNNTTIDNVDDESTLDATEINGIETADLTIEDDVEIVQETKEPEQVLPQITNIFGGVNDSTEALSKISMLAAQITNTVNSPIILNAPESNKDAIELIDDPVEDLSEDVTESGIIDVTSHKPLESDENYHVLENKSQTSKHPWFSELPNDIDFVDDGIQLLDDGIAVENDSFHVDDIKAEIDIDEEDIIIEDQNEDDEKHGFDKKLLLVPLVYTVKLDDMGVLPRNLPNRINNKSLLDLISSKSKVKIKEESIKSESDEESVNIKHEDSIKQVKLSSYLLRKPRHRTYNPIQLCKNPDFNTRLKRLNVGFFSSSRNRLLFKSCQPVTIDVSKAFEDLLVNGTIYLKISEDDNLHKTVVKQESAEHSSVLPSAMPAQSLIDNTKGEIAPYKAINTVYNEVTKLEPPRNKVINLPDITEIRRINQKLLTAQVTPLQVSDGLETLETQMPTKDVAAKVHTPKSVACPASRKRPSFVREQNKTINTTSNVSSDNDLQTSSMLRNNQLWKTGNKIVLWKSREIRPEVPWLSNSSGQYTPDTLLALDSLNKMLCLLTESDRDLAVYESKPVSKNKLKKALYEESLTLKNSKNIAENVDTEDVQVISETHLDSSQASSNRKMKNVNVKAKRKKYIYCCWARERILQMKFSRKRKSKHKCPFPLCLCCCKYDLLEYFKSVKEPVASKEKPPAWVNLLCIEAKHAAKQDNRDVENDTDVAELIPIQKTTKDLPANAIDSVSNIQENTINADVILSNDKGTSQKGIDKSSSCDLSLCSENFSEGVVNVNDSLILGEETSITTSNSSDSIARDESTKLLNPITINEKNPVPIPRKNLRIRITHSDGPSHKNIIRKKYEGLLNEEGQMSNNLDEFENKTNESTLLGVEDSITISKISNVNFDSTQPTTRDVQNDATIPRSQNQLYLCVEPLVNQVDINYLNESNVDLSCSSDRVQQTLSDIRMQVNVENNESNIFIDTINKQKTVKSQGYVKVRNDLLSTKTPNLMKTIEITSQPTEKGSSNQKLIYLNSRQIAELPSDNPIHLGKNKILLTTLKFPPNFKAFEAYQLNLRQTMALPKGITLTLLPNGILTYTRNPKAVISEEFEAAMPHLIEAIQQQIDFNSGVITRNTPPSSKSCPNDEIICLSDEESCDVEKIKDDHEISEKLPTPCHLDDASNNITLESSQSESQTVDHLQSINSADTCNVYNTNTQTTINGKECITTANVEEISGNVNTKVTESAEIPNKNIDISANNSTVNNSSSEINKESSATIIENIEDNTNEDKSKENNNSNTKVVPIDNGDINKESLGTQNENVVDIEENEFNSKENNSKTKNILSDLMAMSGILPAEDTQDTHFDGNAMETVQPSIQEHLLAVSEDPAALNSLVSSPEVTMSQNTPSMEITEISTQSPDKPNTVLSLKPSEFKQTFTPITSLSELKYACSNKGSFYKLDLDTRLLVPINVCMKGLTGKSSYKPPKSSKGKIIVNGPTIDLTDDDVSLVPKESPQNVLLGMNESDKKDEVKSKHTDNSDEDTFDDESDNVNKEPFNKRNKLCGNTSKKVKPLILFRTIPHNFGEKIKRVRKRFIHHHKKTDDWEPARRKRKQDLLKSINAEFVQLADHIGTTDLPDSSSDEEPLANLAIKKRRVENEKQDKISDNIDLPIDKGNNLLNSDVDANETSNVCDNSVELSRVEMEYLDEDLLKEDESCILGV